MEIRKTVTLNEREDFYPIFRTVCMLSNIFHEMDEEKCEHLMFMAEDTGEVLFRVTPEQIEEAILLLNHLLATNSMTAEIF